jgi:hypothetical protein
MDIDNGTGSDARFKIGNGSGGPGGGPRPHFNPEDAKSWQILKAGTRLHHDPTPPGPWVIYFMVGDHQVVEEISSASGQVRLLQAGASFRAHIA